MIARLYARLITWLYRNEPIPPITPDMGWD